MFYDWFMWHFELLDIDTRPPIDDWPISPQTKWCFVEVYARILVKPNEKWLLSLK